MRHSLLTADVSPLIPSDESAILQSQQPATTAVAAAVTSITSEFIHASLVAATQSHHYTESTENTCTSSDISTSYCTIINADCTMSPLLSSSSTRRSRTATCVSAPKMSHSSLATLEYSIHISPRRMTRDLATVFPNKDLSNLLVVPTFQKCHYDMVSWDTEIAKEKDDRLEDVRIRKSELLLLYHDASPGSKAIAMVACWHVEHLESSTECAERKICTTGTRGQVTLSWHLCDLSLNLLIIFISSSYGGRQCYIRDWRGKAIGQI